MKKPDKLGKYAFRHHIQRCNKHGVWNRHYFIEEIKAYKFLILDDILVVNLDNTKTESFAIFLIIFGASLFKRFHLFSRKSKSTCYIHEGKYCMTSKQYTFKNNVSLHCDRNLFYNTKKKL